LKVILFTPATFGIYVSNPTKGIERYGLRLTDATFTAASEPNKGN